MTTNRNAKLTRRAWLLLVALPFIRTDARAASPPPAGRVDEVRGSVTAELGQERRVLSPGDTIHVGEKISTAERSRIQMRLGADTKLRLSDNAQVKIDRFEDSRGEITQEAGSLLLDKPAGSAPPSVRMQGGAGLITARGGKVFAGPSQGVFGVLVLDGDADVRAGGRTVKLRPGEGTDIKSSRTPPTPPRRWGKARIQAALASVD